MKGVGVAQLAALAAAIDHGPGGMAKPDKAGLRGDWPSPQTPLHIWTPSTLGVGVFGSAEIPCYALGKDTDFLITDAATIHSRGRRTR